MIDSEYISPDGILRFIVRSRDGDITMGFDGYPWHTHADILVGGVGSSTEVRAKEFVDALLNNHAVIAVLKSQHDIKDAWITDDPARDVRQIDGDEQVEFRFWDGTRFMPS
ncbi:MAG TPA: hypothetical protein VN723_08025 [Rhizomicrobium sp.]|nr:hypothetical protein [Rhizomicrobium sp.]